MQLISGASSALRVPDLFDGEVVDEVVVVFVQVAVQGDAVALVEQVLERVDPLDAQRALQAVLEVGVVEQDVEAERLGPYRHRLAGATWGGAGETLPGLTEMIKCLI